MRDTIAGIGVVVAGAALTIILAGVSLGGCTEAHATQPPIALFEGTPAALSGWSNSFTVSCTGTAAEIKPTDGQNVLSGYCQVSSTTKVAIGDSGIADPTDAQNSPIHCTTNCPSATFGFVQGTYCRSDTGTVPVYCHGLTSVGPN